MSIFTVIGLGLLAMVVILRFKVPIGAAILAGGAVMWALWNPSIPSLGSAVTEMLSQSRTYDLLLALYFVMCLEIELRKSGTLRGMVDSLNEIFSSTKVTLATMPAFLGLLPSMGGARFSAPIVDEASRGMEISRESKASINFWFRHVCEFMSPIIPGMILGCAVANISVSDLVVHLAWMAVVAFLAGWFVLIRPLRFTDRRMKREHTPESRRRHIREISLAIGPVLVNVILMLVFDVSAGLAMGIVTVLMIPVLHLMKRPVPVRDIFVGALDWKLLVNVTCILYFISVLTEAGILDEMIRAFQSTDLPTPVIIAAVSTVVGILTGMSQGHAAIVMPIVAGIAPGDLNLAGIVMVFGVAGQMITPTHVCLMVTVDYFKSDFFKTLAPIVLLEAIILTIFSVVTYLMW